MLMKTEIITVTKIANIKIKTEKLLKGYQQ